MNAKERRLMKRRQEKRHGLTDKQFRVYKEARANGYSHDSAMVKAGGTRKEWL